ncbi:MAG: HEAT repeat domain-containing protein [Nitrospira sp.]|nr:HEAT repeat domain-containing protein [Nitrospira sp.]
MTQTLEDLLDALEDVDDATREEAAKALAERAEPSTLDALIRACGDDFWSVRAYAGCGAAKISGPKASACSTIPSWRSGTKSSMRCPQWDR